MQDKLQNLSAHLTKTINHEIELSKGTTAPSAATLHRVADNLKRVIDNELVHREGEGAAFDQSHSSGGSGGGSIRRVATEKER